MTNNDMPLKERVENLENWKSEQIVRDTQWVTEFREWQAEMQAIIGDLGGRSVASRLVSIGVDIEEIKSHQVAVDARLTTMDGRLTTMDDRLTTMDGRLTSLESNVSDLRTVIETDVGALKTDVGGLKTDVAQILSILSNR